ncbi:MAG: glutamine--tRNA ligase, partial [Bacteroidetes bacterium]
MAAEIQKDRLNFIEETIERDLKLNKNDGQVHTRFPPEPNGYLHIGHAKTICLNFGIADKYHGLCNLRFDDTNPEKEDIEYVESIKEDIKWLGYDWQDRLYYASDYFSELYELAVRLVKEGLAYVDDQSAAEISEGRGTPTKPGEESICRDRPIEENLTLLNMMRAGKFLEGSKVLRAKIDMSSPNMHLRDPIMYRIRYTTHHRTGDQWCIYPTYDWAHGQSDALEGITHSLCTLEFEVHRPLYEWFIQKLELFPSKQYEFA